MNKYPISFIVLTVLGVLSAIPGFVSFAGLGEKIHPTLSDPMSGLAFIVSAIAFIGSGLFPLVISRLKQAEVEA
jgi:hypothetical protein